MRRILEFEADFPDDQIEENGEIVVPSGRNITTMLRKALMELGWFAEEVEQHSFYGWRFLARNGQSNFFILVADISPKYAVTIERRSWLQNILGLKKKEFGKALGALLRTVEDIGGREPRWFITYDAADTPSLTIQETMRA